MKIHILALLFSLGANANTCTDLFQSGLGEFLQDLRRHSILYSANYEFFLLKDGDPELWISIRGTATDIAGKRILVEKSIKQLLGSRNIFRDYVINREREIIWVEIVRGGLKLGFLRIPLQAQALESGNFFAMDLYFAIANGME